MGSNRCAIIIPYESGIDKRNPESKQEEAVGLARAIHLKPTYIQLVNLRDKRPSTLFGKGTVGNLTEEIIRRDLDLVIVDGKLSPIQQRNLEKLWECKVIDRTALILEIFGDRAQTREGRLQVELASLTYQKSRLVRSWTHLERQRGGHGFMGGPGEKQIESDRRLLNDRITKLKKQLEQVTRTRRLQRESRAKVPYPIVALIGYTNAGKSTLFNRLTDADVLVQDQVFATLDPTLRALELPSGLKVILSDTVGFISNLPTELVAAFRATLEEVVEANLLLHVRDIADEDSDTQADEVLQVVESLLGDEAFDNTPILEVHNKVDKLSPEERGDQGISALTGQGIEPLLERIDTQLSEILGFQTRKITLPAKSGRQIAWLHEVAEVLSQMVEEDEITLEVKITNVDYARFLGL